jgi:hypothetical protein
VTVLHIGGDYHGERRPAYLEHGRVFDLLPIEDPAAGYATEEPSPAVAVTLKRQRYMIHKINWGADVVVWYAFHESFGFEKGTPLRHIFEVLLAHYMVHSEWGEQL